MSKWKQITKTRRLRERKNPKVRLDRITELKRMIKFHKQTLPAHEREIEKLERQARWARFEVESQKRSIRLYEKELLELENYGSN